MNSFVEGHASLPRLHCFEEGTCIVHHVLSEEAMELVRRE